MNLIGIDPGLDGGVALLGGGEDGELVHTWITPTLPHPSGKGHRREYDVPAMRRLLGATVDLAVIESAQARPGQGVSSMFSIGKGFGLWLGLLAGLGIPYDIVHPRRWSGAMLADVAKGDTEAAAAVVATRLFPALDLRASPRCRKLHSGMVDALLIAEWKRRQLLNTPR